MQVVSWSDRGLESIEAAWSELLADSDADPLFNSPEWLQAWWRKYQGVLGASLQVLAVVNGDRLTGLAFFHVREARHKLGLRGTRYELLGTSWRTSGVGFSEKTAFILRKGFEADASAELLRFLQKDDAWDEMIVSHTPRTGPTFNAFETLGQRVGGYLREPDEMEGWSIPLYGGFEAFLASLGKGTRARIVGSRRRFEQAGLLRERVLGRDELNEGWEIFQQLHEARWERPFSSHWREFYGSIADKQVQRGVPVISVLEFNGAPFSVLINFRAGQREYSIASAFIPVDIKRVSPGWMHLGFAIERACADGMTHFDLLGGEGKQEQYKAAFAGHRYDLKCLQLVRKPMLARLYRTWDRLQGLRQRLAGEVAAR